MVVTTDLLDASELVGFPEHCEEVLNPPTGHPVLCLAFNPPGTLVATGCGGGVILIWDYQTRALVRTWKGGHSGDVLCVVWSTDGRQLISGGTEGRVAFWDVLSGAVLRVVDPGCSAVRTLCHGPSPGHLLLTFRSGPAAELECGSGNVKLLPFPGAPPPAPASSLEGAAAPDAPEAAGGAGKAAGGEAPSTSSQAAATQPDSGLIFASARGGLLVIRSSDHAILDAVRIQASLRVGSLELDPGGTRLIVLANDRAVRVYSVVLPAPPANLPARSEEEVGSLLAAKARRPSGSVYHDEQGAFLRPTRRFEQQIERNTWSAATFSGDGEYVLASVAGNDEHVVYAWNAHYGHTDRVLECLRECQGVRLMAWHPRLYPMQLLTVGGDGNVYIWAKIFSDRWTAFAPDFRELEENEEYVEREDEFDVDARPKAAVKAVDADLDADLDVVSRAPEASGSTCSLLYLPIIIQPQDAGAGAGSKAESEPDGGEPMDEDGSGEEGQNDDKRARLG